MALKAYRTEYPEWVVEAIDLSRHRFMNRHGHNEGRHIIEVMRYASKEWEVGSMPSTSSCESVMIGIQRIRLQSPAIIANLCEASGDEAKWDIWMPRIILRPFNILAYLQPRIKDVIESLKKKLDDDGTTALSEFQQSTPTVESQASMNSDPPKNGANSVDDSNKIGQTGLDDRTTLSHLECYAKFVDDNVMPLYSSFNGTSRKTVRFDDLPILFRLGEVVYWPPAGSLLGVHYPLYQPVWRIFQVRQGGGYSRKALDHDMDLHPSFTMSCYYLDYTGSSYAVVRGDATIPSFEGEKSITDLDVYPLRFADGAAKLREDLVIQGNMFQLLVKEPRLHYEGWSIPPELLEDPSDPGILKRTPSSRMKIQKSAPEHIEGPVIIDYEEAFNHHPLWKPRFRVLRAGEPIWLWEEAELPIKHWADEKERRLLYEIRESYLDNDKSLDLQRNEYIANSKAIISSRDGSMKEVDDEDIMLLPRRMIAYTLRDRKFVALDVLSLRNLDNQPDIFEELKIKTEHKRIILSLVKAHFESRKMQKLKPFISLNQDLVYGKGSGLFILLHGVPGVGKTATAEAIAQHYKKPLFSITCGNLGLGPGEVEAELKEVFRLAHLWDCVLLLDEADVFLARRDIGSLKRNALVSVFLRVLEYYSGILFLTTNRVGTIDEAFKSRIHLSLYYERLTAIQMRAIFKANIKRLKIIEEQKDEHLEHTILKESRLVINDDAIMEFAQSHWDNTAHHSRWNGRQIRNAFQIAASLARYDVEADHSKNEILKGKVGPVLDEKQFKLVSNSIKRFDRYFTQTRGENDEQAALLDGIRDDRIRERDLLPAELAHKLPTRREKGTSRRQKATTQYKDDRDHGGWSSKGGSTRKARCYEDEPGETRLIKSKGIPERASKPRVSSPPRKSASKRPSRKRQNETEDSASSDEPSSVRGSESDVSRSEDRSARDEDEEF
ncbi:hypothetical protein B0T25DRAFT_562476 [Lasiosphaeria hispida]|uniref:AAA+ ATPase domain-containing protein n=1 Tax=Lasiosphaeria hispida TaxID=260671 RepID=A0AAJ0HVH7_9PEZI|nr:hypothetical protein B0T25DRAFT_562476 [Lasiosphaeria hispida]